MSLTTLPLVKSHAGITNADDDTILDELLISVSAAMENYMGRVIEQQTAQVELHDSIGQRDIVLHEWPVATLVVVELATTLVLDTDYELVGDRMLRRMSSATTWTGWATGRIKVTYHQGYTPVPEDIALACREQVGAAFKLASDGGELLGVTSRTSTDGSTDAFALGDWQPSVRNVMNHYRRKF